MNLKRNNKIYNCEPRVASDFCAPQVAFISFFLQTVVCGLEYIQTKTSTVSASQPVGLSLGGWYRPSVPYPFNPMAA